VGRHLAPTPLVTHPVLNARVGCETWVKMENTQPLGAFKIRGGLSLLAALSDDERQRGLCSATRGNHGQSLAHAAAVYGVSCTLFVPHGNNPEKNAAMRALGARVIVAGETFDEAWRAAEAHGEQAGARLVHPGREPLLVAGIGTLALEMVEQTPTPLDIVFVPVGVGSCIVGTGLVLRELWPETKLVGVQAASAPAMHQAFHTGKRTALPVSPTVADGLAVGEPVPYTLERMTDLVDDMVLVDEPQLRNAIRLYLETVHQLAEGAGAAALAAALTLGPSLRGARIGVVLSGGNIDRETLGAVLADRIGQD
jgi:threonine dehydratase